MKNIIFALILLTSLSSNANSVRYVNDDGCVVEKEQKLNGVLLYVTKNDAVEFIAYTNDLTSANFAYCANDHVELNSFEGAIGTGLMISCSEHQNGNSKTRGRVDLSFVGEDLTEIKIDGQVKGFFSWKNDVALECLNLRKKQ